jgi:hypothetical protein
MTAPDPLPPAVEFDLDLHEHLHLMERLYSIDQQLGYQLPGELLDRGIELPKVVRLRCSLDTRTGEVLIVDVHVEQT